MITALTLVGSYPELLQLLVDDVGALLARLELIAEAGRPVRLALAVGDGDVVAGVEKHDAFRVVDDPHVDRDRDLPRLLLRKRRHELLHVERSKHAAGGPVDLLHLRRGRSWKEEHREQEDGGESRLSHSPLL